MQQYQVPQFITVEDRIIGQFTMKQFLFLGGGGLIIFILWKFFSGSFFFLPLALLVAGVAAALAFLKIKEQPLPIIIQRAFLFFLRPRVYVWQQPQPQARPESIKKSLGQGPAQPPKKSASRISDLAWSLDVKERLRPRIEHELGHEEDDSHAPHQPS